MKWVVADPTGLRKKRFLSIMASAPSLSDFNIDVEQKAIQDFYKNIGRERVRRVNDTYPQWLPEQPRYVNLRKAQAANLARWEILAKEAAAFAK